ncbi:hypothetical protein EPO15_10760, partial [bacterium]
MGLEFNGSDSNSVLGSTAIGKSLGAAYLNASSQNLFSGCYLYSPTSTALVLQSGSSGNTVQQTRMVSDASAAYGLHLTTASGNTVTGSLIENTTGYGAFLGAKADGNLIDLTTITARTAGYSALYLDNASTNTVSRSFLYNLSGTGVTFGFASSSNTLTRSTVVAAGATAKSFHLYSAPDTLVNQSWLLGAGYGAYVEFGQRALVTLSTVTGSGAVPAFMVAGSSGIVVRDSYVSGPDALDIFTGTGTVGERTLFNATGGAGRAVQLRGGSVGLSLASAVLRAAGVGLRVEPPAAGPLAVDSMTVTASTGIQFSGGVHVATLAAVTFPAAVAVNVDGTALGALSRVTMLDWAGPRGGTAFESDPLGVVAWPAPPSQARFTSAPRRLFPGTTTASPLGDPASSAVDVELFDADGTVAASTWAFHSLLVNSSDSPTLRAGLDPSRPVTAGGDWPLIGPSDSALAVTVAPGQTRARFYVWDTAVGTKTLSAVMVRQDGLTMATATQAVVIETGLRPAPFFAVYSSSLSAAWGSDFPSGTPYTAQASTAADFSGAVASSATLNLWAGFAGLAAQTTYYARIATSPAGPFTALGSTRTRFGDVAGCATSLFVVKGGGGDCTSIGACVALVPSTPLAGDFCIAVMDSAVYSEQVTFSNKNANGFRIRLWGAAGARPTVNPPAGASAGFRILTASVSVAEFNVVTTNTVTYGILASSAQVALSSIAVDSGGKIGGAGVFLSSWTTLSYASVTVQNADGVRVTGLANSILYSTASVAAFSRAAFYLNGASSTTLQDSVGTGNPGYGAFLYHSHLNTLLRSTLRKLSASAGAAGLYLNDASSNTVSGCFVSNAGGTGLDMAVSAHRNLVELSTITAAGAVYDALSLSHGNGNRFSRLYVHSADGNAGSLASGSSESVVEFSSFTSLYPGARALGTNGSSETLTGNMLYAPNGTALGLFGSSITARLNAGFTATGSYPAFYVAGGGYVTVRDSSFENSAGDGGKLERTSYVDIARSTVSGAAGGAGLKLEGASSNTVTASRLAAPGGIGLSVGSYLELFDMTTVTGTGNSFALLDVAASTGFAVSASVDVTLASSTLVGDASGTGFSLGAENAGTLSFSSLTIRGAATALGFADAVIVATITGVSIDASALVSADGTALRAGSRITVRDAAGAHGGSLYEADPLAAVDWVPDAAPFVPPAAPAAPVGLVLGPSSITWTWAAVPGAESYRVRASSDLTLFDSPTSSESVLTSLSPNTTYSVRVAAFAKYV